MNMSTNTSIIMSIITMIMAIATGTAAAAVIIMERAMPASAKPC